MATMQRDDPANEELGLDLDELADVREAELQDGLVLAVPLEEALASLEARFPA